MGMMVLPLCIAGVPLQWEFGWLRTDSVTCCVGQVFFEEDVDKGKYCGHLYGLGTSYVSNGASFDPFSNSHTPNAIEDANPGATGGATASVSWSSLSCHPPSSSSSSLISSLSSASLLTTSSLHHSITLHQNHVHRSPLARWQKNFPQWFALWASLVHPGHSVGNFTQVSPQWWAGRGRTETLHLLVSGLWHWTLGRGGRGSLSGSLCQTSKVQVALASKVFFLQAVRMTELRENEWMWYFVWASASLFGMSLSAFTRCCCLCFLFLRHRFTGMHVSVYD